MLVQPTGFYVLKCLNWRNYGEKEKEAKQDRKKKRRRIFWIFPTPSVQYFR